MDDKIKELIKLATENPDLPIKTFTHHEVVGCDFSYWIGEISRIEINEIYVDERVCFDTEINEYIFQEKYDGDSEFEDFSDEQIDEFIEKDIEELRKKGEVYKCICIFIDI